MEANRRGMKHMCKFCYKSFPCGRSLGGHMRSHLINVSPSDHQNPNKKFPKKKLPPLLNNAKIDIFSIKDHHPNKALKSNDGNVFMAEKLCKECGKSLPSWKALFDHIKSHSGNGKADSLNVLSYSQSDDESETRFCRKKRSERTKRYIATSTNASSLNIANFSPCVSEIDQHEEEEVALSLIMLSRDNMGISSDDKYRVVVEFEGDDSEVNSPKNFIKKRELNQFETDFKRKRSSSKRKLIDIQDSSILAPVDCKVSSDSNQEIKFTCTICKRAFSSYQALGGHRASHKKFNGCCAPRSENNIETESSLDHTDNLTDVFVLKMDSKIGSKRNKDHECPICFKIFTSGQALGGHKRSHITGEQAKINNLPLVVEKPILETRNFLDLNFPAPVEEDCNELQHWWIGGTHSHEDEGFLGLMSS